MGETAQLTALHRKLDHHYPAAYLMAWAGGVRPDWTEFLHRMFSELLPARLGSRGGTVLDLGCGPSISSVIPASQWASNIYLAELLEGNRREIQRWLGREEGAWNWDPYFQFQAELEPGEDESSVERRLRSRLAGVMECDLAARPVLDTARTRGPVDVLICSLVFDVVCLDSAGLEEVMGRALELLQEGWKQLHLFCFFGLIFKYHYSTRAPLFLIYKFLSTKSMI